MLQFEYKDLPEELKNKALLHRARGEGLIVGIGKNGNGRRLWRISGNIKCKDENGKKKIENDEKIDGNNISQRVTV